jgi:hypothetical protein
LTISKWVAWGKGVDVGQLSHSYIRDFVDWVYEKAAEDGGSNPGPTANKTRGNFRAILSWAWEHDFVKKLRRFPTPQRLLRDIFAVKHGVSKSLDLALERRKVGSSSFCNPCAAPGKSTGAEATRSWSPLRTWDELDVSHTTAVQNRYLTFVFASVNAICARGNVCAK